MKPPIDAIRVTCIAAVMIPLSTVGGAGDAISQPFTWGESMLDYPCVLPRGGGEGVVLFTGVSATANASLEAVEGSFPMDWMGKPRLRVGLALRPPGMKLSFEQPSQATDFLLYQRVPERLVLDPDPTPPALLDTVLVNWYPIEGEGYRNRAYFGTAGCGFFIISIQDQILVTGEATANLVAIYAANGDTVEVWGTEVGIPDLELRDTRRSIPIAVEPSTWGSIKASFR